MATKHAASAVSNGQHAGVVMSPSKKSKLSPDSVVMITPSQLPPAADTGDIGDGLSGEEVHAPPAP